jgi:uncharacterized protein YraI
MKFRTTAFMLIILVLASMLATFSVAAQDIVEDEQRAEFQPPILVVNTSFLNVRTGPSSAYPIMLTVVGGTEFPALGIASDGIWYQVSTVVGLGWIDSSFAIARGNFTNVPFVEAPELGVIDFDAMEDMGTTTSSDDSIAQRSFNAGQQWGISIVTDHVTFDSPTINANPVGTVISGDERILPILSAATGDGITWYQTDIPSIGIAWVEGPKSLLRPYACDSTAIVTNVPVRLSAGPDGSGTAVGFELDQGQEAYVVNAADGVYQIALFDGATGWVRQDSVSIRDTEPAAEVCAGNFNTNGIPVDQGGGSLPGEEVQDAPLPQLRSPAQAIINTGFLNIRSGAGSQYSIVATVPGGTTLDITGFAPDGVWYRVRGTFGTGWLNSEFIIFRGNGSAIPVIEDVAGSLVRPLASITNAVTLYAAPNSNAGILSTLSGPIELDIVARTSAADWVQLNAAAGFGWVRTAEITISGDIAVIPVAGG